MKYSNRYQFCFVILALCSLGLGCDEPTEGEHQDGLREACENTGGAFDGDALKCKCGEIICDSGDVCDATDNTKCASFDCVPTASTCVNGTYQVCSERGRWSTLQVCPNGVSCKSAAECGECKDGDTRCEEDPETNAGTLKVCVQGKWEVKHVCSDENGQLASCLKEDGGVSTVCGECINRPTQQCVNITEKGVSSDYQIGHLYICEGGKMHGFMQTDSEIQYTDEKYTKCDSGNSCNPERTDCGECCVGRSICRNDGIAWKDGHPDGHIGQIYTCVDGVISSDPTPCPNETLCDERKLGQSCGECGMTSRWHGGHNCITTSDGRQHSQICAKSEGNGVWTYHGYWMIWDTCSGMCISDTTYGENCYGKCLLSNNHC